MAFSTSPAPQLLLTGATGFIGFRILIQALNSGYQVRAAVRSISSAKSKLLRTRSLASSPHLSNLSFIEVPDILAPGAYIEAVKGVEYVIHCASPLAAPHLTDYENEIIKPAITGTLELLRAATTGPRIKRIVITSSVAANRPVGTSADVKTDARSRIPTPTGPFGSVFEAYAASKAAALNAAEEWLATEKPVFDVVHIMPSFAIGRNELAGSPKELLSGTAGFPILHLVMPDNPFSKARTAAAVDVGDVAEVHVQALNKERIEGNRAYGVTRSVAWQEAFRVVEKAFPKATREGVFKDTEITTQPTAWNGSETEKVFGINLRSFEDSTVEVAGQWLEVLGKEKA